jgi:hypothetical protein
MHYDNERELEVKHEIKDINMTHYTKQMWFDEIKDYLVNVMGMNESQVKKEFDTRFPDLLDRGLGYES